MPEKNNLRITNVVCTGKFPIKLKYPNDWNKIISKSKYYCQVVNENICAILQFKFEKNNVTVNRKKGFAVISIWASGSVNIVGVLSLEEARNYVNKVILEIKRIMGED